MVKAKNVKTEIGRDTAKGMSFPPVHVKAPMPARFAVKANGGRFIARSRGCLNPHPHTLDNAKRETSDDIAMEMFFHLVHAKDRMSAQCAPVANGGLLVVDGFHLSTYLPAQRRLPANGRAVAGTLGIMKREN